MTRAWDCTNNGYVVTNPADNGKGLWIFLPGETLRLDADTAQPEYQFRKDTIAFGYTGQRAELSVAGVPDRCTENRRASIQEDAKLRGMDFWATGNEPPWKLEIGPEKILLNTGYESTVTEFPPTVPVSDDSIGKATYVTQGKAGLLAIEISGGGCSDSMSGESFASIVTIRLSTDTSTEQATTILSGCGRALH